MDLNTRERQAVMKNYQQNFHRREKKYLLSEHQYKNLMAVIEQKLEYDKYRKYRICNIYFDTPQFDLIRNSISKPLYKEKFRLRSYGTQGADSTVHLEIKKKYDGVVYKRRFSLRLEDAMNYCIKGEKTKTDHQIFREIDWFFSRYELYPVLYISYDRVAMKGVEENDLRITFDNNILWRTDELDLLKGDFGSVKLDHDQYIMEIKTAGGMPIWLCQALSQLRIYPTSYSKYGRIYQDEMTKLND